MLQPWKLICNDLPLPLSLLCRLLQVGEGQVSALLPYVVAGLGSEVIPDYRAATLMVISQLASRVAMSGQLATGERGAGGAGQGM